MKWTELLNGAIEDSYAATDKLVGMVEDGELDWKPATGENWMTMGQLLMHFNGACGACCKGFVTGDWGMPEGVSFEDLPPEQMMPPAEKMPFVESVAQARELLAADKAVTLKMVAQAGEADLESKIMSAPWAPGMELSLGMHLLHMVQHLVQHKTQLYYYLKLLGRPVNTKHLYGM
jgi:uncharacterized damage-inducible protein DinB